MVEKNLLLLAHFDLCFKFFAFFVDFADKIDFLNNIFAFTGFSTFKRTSVLSVSIVFCFLLVGVVIKNNF